VIDFELANVETLLKDIEHLPMLLKQMYYQRNWDDELSGAMILISFKNSFKFGWFLVKLESKVLLTIAREIGKIYCTLGNVM